MIAWTVPGLLAVPAVTWLVCYLLLAREFRTWNLLGAPIHESGKYSLCQTVFYYNHFLRELPLDTLYACAVLWSCSVAGYKLPHNLPEAGILRVAPGVLLLLVFCGSLSSVGVRSTMADLLQFRETDTRVGWGSHWQMHFLSTAVLLLVLLLPGLLLAHTSVLNRAPVLMVAVFLGLSVVFRCGYRSMTDARWVLHGAREVFTYVVIVAVPAFVPLLQPTVLARIQLTAAGAVTLVLLVGAAVYFLRVYRGHDLNEEASSRRGLVYLLSSHFFEHVLDYVYILVFILAVAVR